MVELPLWYMKEHGHFKNLCQAESLWHHGQGNRQGAKHGKIHQSESTVLPDFLQIKCLQCNHTLHFPIDFILELLIYWIFIGVSTASATSVSLCLWFAPSDGCSWSDKADSLAPNQAWMKSACSPSHDSFPSCHHSEGKHLYPNHIPNHRSPEHHWENEGLLMMLYYLIQSYERRKKTAETLTWCYAWCTGVQEQKPFITNWYGIM